MLSYLGRHLLDRLRLIPGPNGNQLWLLNGAGYWLMGPRPDLEWGFMFPNRSALRFSRRYEGVWSYVRHGSINGQFFRNGGLFTYARLAPMALLGGSGSARWILVSHLTRAALAAT